MKSLFLSIFALLISGCSTFVGYPGHYSIKAYDSNGNRLDSNINLISAGSRLYPGIYGACTVFPGATLVIRNIKTGKELLEKSPYKCRGKEADIIYHEFVAPKLINFSDSVYKLTFKKIEKDIALYEYTLDGEKVTNWNKLISLSYRKKAKNYTPEQFVLERKRAFGSQGIVLDGSAYTRAIFNPDSKHSYYETAVSKSFHIKKCNGLIALTYAKKYSENKNGQIELENKGVSSKLKNNSWSPICMNVQNKKF